MEEFYNETEKEIPEPTESNEIDFVSSEELEQDLQDANTTVFNNVHEKIFNLNKFMYLEKIRKMGKDKTLELTLSESLNNATNKAKMNTYIAPMLNNENINLWHTPFWKNTIINGLF